MKNTRKIFAIIMAVVMCFSMLSVTAFATDTEYLVSVTTADGTTIYTDWEEARDAASANVGSTLKLLTDYTFDNSTGIYNLTDGEFTLDLNGFTVERGVIVKNATITFIDSADEKGTIVNDGNVAIFYYSGTLIFDESADFLGKYADHDPWHIYNYSEEEMVIGEDIIIPDDFAFMDYSEGVVIDTLPVDAFFYVVDVIALSEYELFVGGVAVNADNAEDILGDGTASYNAETNELYLDGLNIEGAIEADSSMMGIFADGDLNIVLADGSVNTIKSLEYEQTFGIGIAGHLYITGDGTLEAYGADVENYDSGASIGIIAMDGLTVEGATVYAIGGDMDATDYVQSSGVQAYGDIVVDFGGVLIAEGGDVVSAEYTAYSNGIVAQGSSVIMSYDEDEEYGYYGNIAVYDGYLEANGGNTTGYEYALSTGMYLLDVGVYTYDSNSALVVNNGDATVTSTNEEDEPQATNVGICTYAADIGIYGGSVDITTGECNGLEKISYGMYAVAYEDDDGSFSGGNVSIYCDEVTVGEYSPSLVGTRVNISTTNGVAIHAEMGIEIGENLAIVNPENAEASEYEDEYGDLGYTVLNADGEIADQVTIGPLGYKVTINGLNNGMAAEVPAGMSLNEFYCEFFGVEDFSEVLNTEKEGYTFGGFYTDENCTDGNEFSFDDEITGDITIYAKWIANEEDNEQNNNQQGGNEDNQNNQNNNNEETKPVPDPEIPNTDATENNAWVTILLVSAFGIALIMNSNKKKVFSK